MRESVRQTERGQAKHFIVKVTNDTSQWSIKAIIIKEFNTSFIPNTNYNLASLFISSHLFLFIRGGTRIISAFFFLSIGWCYLLGFYIF